MPAGAGVGSLCLPLTTPEKASGATPDVISIRGGPGQGSDGYLPGVRWPGLGGPRGFHERKDHDTWHVRLAQQQLWRRAS